MRPGRSRLAFLVGLAGLVSAGLALTTARPALSQPYRWVDERGVIHYTDQPPQHGGVKLENLNPAARRRGAEPPLERRQGEPAAVDASSTAAAPRPTAPPSRPDVPEHTGAPAPPTPPRPAVPPTDPEPAASPPGAVTADGVEAAREMMALSGIDGWLDHAVTLARREFGPLRWRLDDPETAWAAVARGFRRDEMAPVAARCLLAGLTEADREAALAWLRSPLLQRARQLRDDARTPARRREYRDFVSRLPGTPAPAPRLALVHALEGDNHGAALQIEVQRTVRRAVADAIQPLTARGRRATIESAAEARRDTDEDHVRFYNVTMMLFAYRALPDADLQEMVRIARSPAGVRFNEAYQGCIRAALTAAERRAALEVRPLVRRAAR